MQPKNKVNLSIILTEIYFLFMFQGAGEIIPGGATLFFDIEVITFFGLFQENY